MAKKKKTKKKRSFNKRSLIKEIMKVFRLNPKKTFNYRQLSKEIGIKEKSIKELIVAVLYDLQEQKKLILISPGKYKYKKNLSFIEGVVDVTTSGNAYVRVEEMEQDIFIKDKHLLNAISGDIVKVSLFLLSKSENLKEKLLKL